MKRYKVKAKMDPHPGSLHARTLGTYIQAHLNASTTGLLNLVSSPISTLIIILTIGVSLCLPASGYLVLKNFKIAFSNWDQGNTLTLFLEHQISEKNCQTLKSKLLAHPSIEKVVYQSPQEALEEFKAANEVGGFADTLPTNPLPGVFTLSLSANGHTQSELKALQTLFSNYPHVDQVVIDSEWVEKFFAILTLLQSVAWLLSSLISAGLILVICNTVRLALERHRDEIEVMSLIGATQRFIRRPFLYRGMWYGILGAMLAWALMVIIESALNYSIVQLNAEYEAGFRLENMGFLDTIILLLASLSLGWIGAWVAVWHQWRDLAPESALKA